MEHLGRGGMAEVMRYNGLIVSPIFNSAADEARKNKQRLRQLDSKYGRHTKYRRPEKIITAQRAHFRVTPLFNIEELNKKPIKDQKHATCAADACAWDSAKSRVCLIPVLLKEAAQRQERLSPLPMRPISVLAETPTPASSPALVALQSDTSCMFDSESSTPLPMFPHRLPVMTDRFLCTRPTIFKALPLDIKEELFTIIADSIDLRPLPFKKTADSYKFYETNFPLLLTTITAEQKSQTTSKRSRTPESPMSVMIARKRWLNERLIDLECLMVSMEKATEGIQFRTELHDPVFDPTTWPWNKMDVTQLRRRYTIDASLREM